MSSTPKGLEKQHAPITGAYPSSIGAHASWELSPEQRAHFEESGYLSPIQLLRGFKGPPSDGSDGRGS